MYVLVLVLVERLTTAETDESSLLWLLSVLLWFSHSHSFQIVWSLDHTPYAKAIQLTQEEAPKGDSIESDSEVRIEPSRDVIRQSLLVLVIALIGHFLHCHSYKYLHISSTPSDHSHRIVHRTS